MELIIVKNNVRWSYINNPDYHVMIWNPCYPNHEEIIYSGTYDNCVKYRNAENDSKRIASGNSLREILKLDEE